MGNYGEMESKQSMAKEDMAAMQPLEWTMLRQ